MTTETDSDQSEAEVEQTFYHVGVEHTDTLTGAPDLTEVQVRAESEEDALENAKRQPQWPEERHYDEDDVGVREL